MKWIFIPYHMFSRSDLIHKSIWKRDFRGSHKTNSNAEWLVKGKKIGKCAFCKTPRRIIHSLLFVTFFVKCLWKCWFFCLHISFLFQIYFDRLSCQLQPNLLAYEHFSYDRFCMALQFWNDGASFTRSLGNSRPRWTDILLHNIKVRLFLVCF